MASKGGKVPPVMMVAGVAGAGILVYLWWRNRSQGTAAGASTATPIPLPVTPLPAGNFPAPAPLAPAPVLTGQPVPVTPIPVTSTGTPISTGVTIARTIRHALTRTGKRLTGPASLAPGTLPAHSPYAGTAPALGGGTYPAGKGIIPAVTAPRGTPYTGGPWSIFTNGGGPLAAVAWGQQLLHALGAPVTRGNLQFVYQWQKSEGGGGVYNPLNQGPVPGAPQLTTSGVQYGGGAANFATWKAGIQGAVAYLHMPNFAAITSALRAQNPAGAKSALIASPWAASHYGNGANWYNGPLPALPHPARSAVLPRPPVPVSTRPGAVPPLVAPAPARPSRAGTALQRFLARARPRPRPAAHLRSAGVVSRYAPALPRPVPARRAPARYYNPPLRSARAAYRPPRGSRGRFVR